ncbi:MAG: hypothetical protein M1826_002802 [Phylliscum demangeonii]|nr:MAG: hypothetical protein M1826_002802 [Phylliscum demangeonii]
MHSVHRGHHEVPSLPRRHDFPPIETRSDLGNPPRAVLEKRRPAGSGGGASSGAGGTSAASAPAPTHTCGPKDTTGLCQRPTDASNTSTIAIALGVAIPVFIAAVIFLVLHRRHVKKLRKEDANDKHQELDFGLDEPGRKPNRSPEMSGGDGAPMGLAGLRSRGLSMDLGSPYILPPGLHGSQESLHSLARTGQHGDDRYRPATIFPAHDRSGPPSSALSPSRLADDASTLTGRSVGASDPMTHELVRNAAGMPTSNPPAPRIPSPEYVPFHPARATPQPAFQPRKDSIPSPSSATAVSSTARNGRARDSYIDRDRGGMRQANHYLAALITASDAPASGHGRPQASASPAPAPATAVPAGAQHARHPTASSSPSGPSSGGRSTVRRKSVTAPVTSSPDETLVDDDASIYPEDDPPAPASGHDVPRVDSARASVISTLPDMLPSFGDGRNLAGRNRSGQRRSMGVRPLPPDHALDDPEQRANRIRSFYKEYFDETKPATFPAPATYHEDDDQSYLDPAHRLVSDRDEHGTPRRPFAEPLPRRAMTPPPRGPPGVRAGPFPPPSLGGATNRASRAFSASSGPMRSHGGLRPPLPPPPPLRVLPTPHRLREDSFATPIDFAPPTSYKDRQAGRPDSPLGGVRPYSPAVPAHLPLASSFDDLAVMPSPHALRKSGTFTGLDFAPPPRFKQSDAGSDAGSIRSGRSNGSAMSNHHLQSIRAGAYRVSRLPKDFVGTRDDLAVTLRPTWDMRRPA